MIKTADRIIDLGPEVGDAGFYVVPMGTPEEIAATPQSYTGQYLKQALDRRRKTKRLLRLRNDAASDSFWTCLQLTQSGHFLRLN